MASDARQGPALTIAGTCEGCAHLRPSSVGGALLGFVDCAHPSRPVPFFGNVNTSTSTPPTCPLLPAAQLALARSIVAEPSAVLADIVGPAVGVVGVGRECEEPGMVAVCDHCGEVPWLPRRAHKARAPCPHVETAECSAAHGAGESEEQKR